MRKKIAFFNLLLLFMSGSFVLHAQSTFTEVKLPGVESSATNGIVDMVQDHQGYLWIVTKSKGVYKYDGSVATAYLVNSAAPPESIAIDSNGVIWIGTLGGGLNKLDPVTGKITNFKHQVNDAGSVAHDTVTALLVDHENNLWVGTYRGLDLYDRTNGKFIHHPSDKNIPTSLSSNHVRAIYEDREGVLWVGCGSPVISEQAYPGEGGLNRFDKRTDKFTRYLHNANDSSTISNNKVRGILEDSKGNFWIGTAGDGLQTLNRQTGVFTHYYYDSTHPKKLSRGPLLNYGATEDHITFIKEDTKANIWIGTCFEGIVEFNLQTKKITHYGYRILLPKPNDPSSAKIIAADTASGFSNNLPWAACVTKDGLVWVSTLSGSLYKADDSKKITLPFTNLLNGIGGNSFYEENDSTLWIATAGLIKRNTRTGKEKFYLHNEHNANSIAVDNVSSIVKDNSGYLWLGTTNGMDRFDPVKQNFIHYKAQDSTGLSDNNILYMLIDHDQNLWIGTINSGLDKMNIQTGKFSHFRHDAADSNSLSNNQVLCIAEDKSNIWAATANGLDRIGKKDGALKHFLKANSIKAVFIDANGVVWAGAQNGMFYFNSRLHDFVPFSNVNVKVDAVLGINGDSYNNLWVTARNAIFKIDNKRENVSVYTAANGVHPNTFLFCNNITTKEDELLLGDQIGYYHFFPKNVAFTPSVPNLNITSFRIGNKEIEPGPKSILHQPLYQTNTIKLAHDQNSFAIGFSAILFRSKNNERYMYKMENYDSAWHDVSEGSLAYFFSLPPGKYIFRARAVSADGGWAEKDLSIIISPPWWTTWWAITAFILLLIAVIWTSIYYRSRQLVRHNKILEEKVASRTKQLKKSLEELKATQQQLIQSEKMASLGELTAGIAHEIQNPLNFVNNFSDVNKEMLEELKAERLKPEAERDETLENDLINDVIANEEKINHHGKRADAIVKGMLQHSRKSSGQKEPTDINALADEYLRLSYHGLRAKDKSFNADFKTDFDESIGKINIVPQDIGRVLLNLFNNAFYAVNQQKSKNLILSDREVTPFEKVSPLYTPTVSVTTKKRDDKIQITVKDNGSGIPQNVIDKIFQPFFTTKPAGSGTGLGLSLSYDIIKAHGGEIKVESNEGEASPDDPVGRGTKFIIQLPFS